MMEPDTEGGSRASGGFYCQQSVDIDYHSRQPEMQFPFNQSVAQQRQQTSASPSHGLLEPNTVGPLPPRHRNRMSFRQHREDTASVQLEERTPGMQPEDSSINLSLRYPKQLCTLELCRADVRVRHLQEGPLLDLQSGYRQPRRRAYNMQPQGDGQARGGWGFFESGPLLAVQVYWREGQTESSESTDQVRYSVEETNQCPDKSQPVEHMDTHSLPQRLTSNRQHREDTASVQLQERSPGMQQEESHVNLSSRYPKQLLGLCRADVSVEHLQEGPLSSLQSGYRQPRRSAYNMQPQGDEQASRGWGVFESGPLLEGQTESSESTKQVRFSVEETNQFPDKSQPVEHMDTHSLPQRLTSNKLCCPRGKKRNTTTHR